MTPLTSFLELGANALRRATDALAPATYAVQAAATPLATAAVAVALAVPAATTATLGTLGETTTTVEGTVVAITDGTEGGERSYAIKTDAGTIQIDPAGEGDQFADAGTGDEVVAKVAAAASADALPSVVSASITPQVAAAASSTSLNLYVVAVNDSYYSGSLTVPQAQTAATTALNYWTREARGAYTASAVAGVKQLNLPRSCELDPDTMRAQATAQYPGVDFFGAGTGNHLVVFLPEDCNGWGGPMEATWGSDGLASGGLVTVAGNNTTTLIKFLGYNFGLNDSNISFEFGGGWWKTWSRGMYGPMSYDWYGMAPSSLGIYEQELFGLTNASSLRHVVRASESFTLNPVNDSTGTRGATFTDPSNGDVYYIEYRAGAYGSDNGTFLSSPDALGAIQADEGLTSFYFDPGLRIYKVEGGSMNTLSWGGQPAAHTGYGNNRTYVSDSGAVQVWGGTPSGGKMNVTVTLAGGITGPIATTIHSYPPVGLKFGETGNFDVQVEGDGGVVPEGTVEFVIDGVSAATKPLDSLGRASYTIPATTNSGTRMVLVMFHPTSLAEFLQDTDIVNLTIAKTTSTTTATTSGNTVTATVTSAAGTPTGTVELYNGATKLTTATLSGAAATLNVPALAAGTYTLTAKYLGTPNIAGSTGTVSYTVTPVGTTTTATAGTAAVGGTSTITATVTAANSSTPTGSVQLLDGATVVATSPLTAGTTTLNIPATAAGTKTYTVNYVPTGLYTASNGTVDVTVTKASSTTTATTSGTTVTATVTSGAGTPTGTVELYNGATTLTTGTLSGGDVTLNVPALAAGTYTLTANYLGNANIAASSGTVSYTVTPVGTTTTATAGSATVGGTSTITATVTAANASTPLGTVQLLDGATVVATSPLAAGTAALTIPATAAGTKTYTVNYVPSGLFAASTGTVDVTVNKATSTTTATTTGTTVTATVTSAAGTPTGSVELYDGTTLLTTGTLSAGKATLNVPALDAGTYTLTAKYLGNANINASSGTVSYTVTPVATTTSATASTTAIGGTSSVNASVTAANGSDPTGTVELRKGATVVATSPLTGGAATFNVPATAAGTATYTVTYVPTGLFAASSGTVDVTVTKAPSSTVVTSTAADTFDIKVTATGATPTGTVELYDGTTKVGQGTLDASGSLTVTTSPLAQGAHPMSARYLGDNNVTASTGTVTYWPPVATTTTVTAAATQFGTPVAVRAVVTPANGTAPAGRVDLYRNGSLVTSSNLTSNNVTFSLTDNPAPGSYTYSATFVPAGTQLTSTGTASASVTKTTSQTAIASNGADSYKVSVQTATGIAPTGTVELYNGATKLTTGTLAGDGSVDLTVSGLTAGPYTLTAKYLGDTTTSDSAASITYAPTKTPTSTTANATGAQYGTAATVTATVTSADTTPAGTVNVKNGMTTVASGTLVDGAVTVKLPTTLTPGVYNLTVEYAGSTTLAPSSAAVTFAVDRAPSTATPTSATWKYGAPAALRVAIASPKGGVATGPVDFFDVDGNFVASTQLVQGVATMFMPANTPVGAGTIEARYAGTNLIAPVTGQISYTVAVAKSTTSASIKSSAVGAASIAVVVDADTRILANDGEAQIWFGTQLIASAPVVNGTALVQLPADLPAGRYTWKAVYANSPNITGSQYSPIVALTIK